MQLRSFDDVVAEARFKYVQHHVHSSGWLATLIQAVDALYRPSVEAHLRIVIPFLLVQDLKAALYTFVQYLQYLEKNKRNHRRHVKEVVCAIEVIVFVLEEVEAAVKEDLGGKTVILQLETFYNMAFTVSSGINISYCDQYCHSCGCIHEEDVLCQRDVMEDDPCTVH